MVSLVLGPHLSLPRLVSGGSSSPPTGMYADARTGARFDLFR